MANRYFWEVTFKDGSTARYVAETKQEALEKAKEEVLPEFREGLSIQQFSTGPVVTRQVS